MLKAMSQSFGRLAALILKTPHPHVVPETLLDSLTHDSSYVANKKLYLYLIREFLRGELDGEDFSGKFFHLWKTDLDEERARIDAWAERYNLQLIEAGEFGAKWAKLHGYFGHEHLLEMLSEVFAARDSFDPEPEGEFEIDEAHLRNEVAAYLAAYEAAASRRSHQ